MLEDLHLNELLNLAEKQNQKPNHNIFLEEKYYQFYRGRFPQLYLHLELAVRYAVACLQFVLVFDLCNNSSIIFCKLKKCLEAMNIMSKQLDL